MSDRGSRLSAQLIIGLALAVVGVLFTLDNLDLIASGPILRWWPLVLVLIGLTRLLGLGVPRQSAAGWLFTGIGTLLLLSNLDLIRFGVWDLWPLVLVVGGATLVFRGMRRGRDGGPAMEPDDYVHSFVMMGAVVRKLNSSQFRGGEATAIMGGVELDLRNAHAAGETVVIDLLAWWGGVEIWVPHDWKVTSEVVPFMAGVEDKSKPAPDAKTHLILRGLVVMGGVEVGN
jgi:predicted membrane protein